MWQPNMNQCVRFIMFAVSLLVETPVFASNSYELYRQALKAEEIISADDQLILLRRMALGSKRVPQPIPMLQITKHKEGFSYKISYNHTGYFFFWEALNGDPDPPDVRIDGASALILARSHYPTDEQGREDLSWNEEGARELLQTLQGIKAEMNQEGHGDWYYRLWSEELNSILIDSYARSGSHTAFQLFHESMMSMHTKEPVLFKGPFDLRDGYERELFRATSPGATRNRLSVFNMALDTLAVGIDPLEPLDFNMAYNLGAKARTAQRIRNSKAIAAHLRILLQTPEFALANFQSSQVPQDEKMSPLAHLAAEIWQDAKTFVTLAPTLDESSSQLYKQYGNKAEALTNELSQLATAIHLKINRSKYYEDLLAPGPCDTKLLF